jgi:15-cis-phytoene synthase
MTHPPRSLEEPYRNRAIPPGNARYWSWLFAARASHEPLLGIYALQAEWRALTHAQTDPTVAQLKLAWWRDEMQRLSDGTPVHPIGLHLASLPRAAQVDFSPLQRSVEAAMAEAQGAPLERAADLYPHSMALDGMPLLIAARLAGESRAMADGALDASLTALAAAEYLAHALANYRREARHGRVLFPVEELLAAGIANDDLAAETPPTQLQRYLDEVRRRAADLFTAAAHAVPRTERPALRHMAVLAALGANRMRDAEHPAGSARGRLRDLYLAWSAARGAAHEH